MKRVACGMLQDAAERILSLGHEISISDLVSLPHSVFPSKSPEYRALEQIIYHLLYISF